MRSLPVAVATTLALTLGGCVPDGAVAPSPAATASEHAGGPSVTPSPSSEPSTVPSPAPSAPAGALPSTPVSIGCNELVGLQAVYDFNPNYGNQPDFSPPRGSNAATIAASGGTVCNWVNQTSGETFIVAVAQPARDRLAALRAAAGSAVPGVGEAAYFSTSGGVGEAQVFSGPYWLVGSSTVFYDFETAKPLLTAALSALGR